ncbi:MAG: SDR family oxidoreductase [Proteobacteria bacterium]|nr:SDR family oxidoreductase [Pseudomonadota bacterium]
MNRFANRTALVTGGSTGIGRAIANRLAAEGADVVITGRREAPLKEAASQHEKISYVVADVGRAEDVARTLQEVNARHGRLDVLVNNAGVAPIAPLRELDMDQYDHTFEVNVRGLVDTTRQALPLLQATKGAIVNISSSVALRPLANMSIYSASKAAVSALTKSWGKELARDGIRVNSVIVGPIETPIYQKTQLSQAQAQAHIDAVRAMVPLGRFGDGDEVAAMVAFLASDEARFVTASEYAVDGGSAA